MMTTSTTTGRPSEVATRPFLRSPRRLALATLGVVCVGIGAVGVVVPGLPTTIFLIAASYFFTRSCPVLEERMRQARIFRPYLPYMDGDRPLPTRLRVRVIAIVWTAVSGSLAMLHFTGALTLWCGVGIVASAIVGTIVIARVRREAREARPAEDPGRRARLDGIEV
jgi:uncharacterized membrane protein YbaN (DUF454 family)